MVLNNSPRVPLLHCTPRFSYGFALPENPDDFLPMALDIPHAQIGTELGNYKTAMLRSLGLDAGQSLGPGGPSVRLQNVVRVLSLRHVGELDDLAPDFNVTLDLIPVSHVRSYTATLPRVTAA